MLILGIVCIALALVLATRLFRGRGTDDVPVSSAPLDQANETYPRLRAVSALRDGDAGLDDFTPRPFRGPAAKGFKRDEVIGRDVLRRADREWTQPVNRRDMH
jgi:hypothetical protein